MAPEQARGKTVDRRADTWSFGVVVFEMLTGRRAFGGDDVSHTLALVMTKEPEWAAVPSSTPPALRGLLRRCLDKDPKRRLQAIGDARLKFRVWAPKLVAPGRPNAYAWDLAPDGKRVALLTPVNSSDGGKQEHVVVLLQNFFDELRRRVPLGK
jgi:serine/threonine protein kinase